MKEINNTTEFAQVINQDKPVLLDFYADWCGPCQALLPTINDLANENEDVIISKVNVDKNPELAQQFAVRSIPALFFIKNGEVIERAQGVHSKAQLEQKIETLKAA